MNARSLLAGGVLLAVLAPTAVEGAQGRRAVPRGQGSAPRAAAPSRPSAPSGTRASGPRTPIPPRGTASGVARYGYGYGGYSGYPYYGYYPYYPYYPFYPGWDYGYGWWGGAGYWSVGLYGSWGWPCYGCTPYGSWYAPYDAAYVAAPLPPTPSGPAILETDIQPARAEVVLDGQAVGYAKDFSGRWDELEVSAGHHVVAFRHEGYRTLEVELDAAPGGMYRLDDQLARGEGTERRVIAAAVADPAPAAVDRPGRLTLTVQPPDAAVYVDGSYLGTGLELGRLHGAIPLAAGEHRIEVVRPGFRSDSRSVSIEAGGASVLDIALDPLP